ncbi:MAG: ABC transporter ATP-binding protein [Oscillospiraceae bacterium]|jgi:iron complex transport system ATP-binding protein|nr:ABC transporter ATP-binding protein [Oscillospiraceae bacterium]
MTLKVSGLRFAYKNHEVLKGVDFSANAGECVCLLGENGAGKTTLFRCLLGLLGGYSGDILIDGDERRGLSAGEIARRVAYIPQASAPAFNYSVFETVLMGTNARLSILGSPGAAERELAAEMLELMNISHLSDRGCAEISGGERQLAMIARALAQKSRILVMDEPTANLDYGNQLRVMRRIRQLADKGYLVLLSTHNPEHALQFGHRALVLENGVAAMCGKPEDILTPAAIEEIYGVKVALQTLNLPWGRVPVLAPCFE